MPTTFIPRCCSHTGQNARVQTGKHEPICESAIKVGVKLLQRHMKTIILDRGLAPLTKGTGVRGSVKNIDLATYLVQNMYPDESTQEQNRMILAMLGKSRLGCAKDIVRAVSLLDPRESQSFDKLRKSALDELEADAMTEAMEKKYKQDEPQDPGPAAEEPPPLVPDVPADTAPEAPASWGGARR